MIEQAYVISERKNSYRCGDPALIIGVEVLYPVYKNPIISYRIKFSDGTECHTPINSPYIKIISKRDLKK